ncbi:ATPase inhibitor [Elasticomyces elasticus]|nr:ATPase inhibitor [Elasticomyces elasticus]KAK4996757.1 ATPase inhibitor [Elasticomyces elasticus]KAK5010528.1 hypothetical protein LTR28_009329 [Elasticomyces elasticus]
MSRSLTVARTLRAIRPTTQTARFSITARSMAGGDTGAPRSGGAAQGDAFTRREQASEDFHIRQHEAEKLKALKEKIAAQQKQVDELEKKNPEKK